ncbi:MAG TPA: hypothetical protein VLM40_14740 [Gemmata sp.]|nr:hypothetical protein [Gemmata sp.]
MITFDEMRSALLSPEPLAGLDRLVCAELAAGRKTSAIHDELLAHLDSILAMPEYTESLEETFGDILDALWGWGNPAFWYTDAHEPPTTPPNHSNS